VFHGGYNDLVFPTPDGGYYKPKQVTTQTTTQLSFALWLQRGCSDAFSSSSRFNRLFVAVQQVNSLRSP
jgi:hypothetical protein